MGLLYDGQSILYILRTVLLHTLYSTRCFIPGLFSYGRGLSYCTMISTWPCLQIWCVLSVARTGWVHADDDFNAINTILIHSMYSRVKVFPIFTISLFVWNCLSNVFDE